MLAEKVDLNVEAVQELPSAYCVIINPKKNDYNKVVISRVEEIIKAKGETWKSIEKAIGVEKLWNKVHKKPKESYHATNGRLFELQYWLFLWNGY